MKAVHKALVLKYHPDKLGREATKKDEEAFACITKSAEILSDPQKRRAFDSVDPEFDNSIPKGDSKDLMKNFYEIFEPVFERNSRWAIHRSKVLKLGMLPASESIKMAFILCVPDSLLEHLLTDFGSNFWGI